MPNAEFPHGIYLVSRPMEGKTGGLHFAVIFYGQLPLNLHEDGNCYPVVAELSPPGISVKYFEGGWWTIHHQVAEVDEAAAVARLDQACSSNPDYALLMRNCEQFARWVTTGVWESKQLQTVGVIAAAATICFMAASSDTRTRRAG